MITWRTGGPGLSTPPTPVTLVEAVCTGTSSDMGMAQGLALRDRIHAARSLLYQLESFRLRQPWWLPYPVYRWLAGRKAARMLGRPLARLFPETSLRLEGIAAGAGVGLETIYLYNAMEPLLSSVGGCTACPGACSAVAVRGRRSATGEPVLARNFDYIPLVKPLYTLRESRPLDGFRSIDFTLAPLVGAVDGLNGAGLAITYDYAFTNDIPSGPAATISIIISEALERCATVREAAAWITNRPRWGAGLLMLADASGDIASLEISATRHCLRRPAAGEDVLFHTNAFAGDETRAVQLAKEAVFTELAPTPLRGRRLHESSEKRDARFLQLLAAKEVFDADALAAVMADHGPDNKAGEYTPCVHSDYWNTTASLQFFPRSKKLRVAFDAACRARYEDITL